MRPYTLSRVPVTPPRNLAFWTSLFAQRIGSRGNFRCDANGPEPRRSHPTRWTILRSAAERRQSAQRQPRLACPLTAPNRAFVVAEANFCSWRDRLLTPSPARDTAPEGDPQAGRSSWRSPAGRRGSPLAISMLTSESSSAPTAIPARIIRSGEPLEARARARITRASDASAMAASVRPERSNVSKTIEGAGSC